jgi:hypothetical protein
MTEFNYQDYVNAGYSATPQAEVERLASEALAFFNSQLKPHCTNATPENIAKCLGAMIDQKYFDQKQLGSESIAGYSYTMSETQKVNARATQASWAYFASIYCGLVRAIC